MCYTVLDQKLNRFPDVVSRRDGGQRLEEKGMMGQEKLSTLLDGKLACGQGTVESDDRIEN